jgi:hypothetical protein
MINEVHNKVWDFPCQAGQDLPLLLALKPSFSSTQSQTTELMVGCIMTSLSSFSIDDLGAAAGSLLDGKGLSWVGSLTN